MSSRDVCGGSTSSAVSDDLDKPITFLTATARIQKMGLKQRSARRVHAAKTRASFAGATAATKAMAELDLSDRISNSERLPLNATGDGHLVDYSDANNHNNNNSNANGLDASSYAAGEIPDLVVEISTKDALIDIVCGKFVSLFLLVIPVACWANFFHWHDQWIFWLNFVVMVPLASILGDFTEELALHTNQTIGGLLNATFGNAVEVVVAIQALMADEIRVVQASMLGSIFSNLLLVLGSCFFFGGLYYKEQKINSAAATSSMGLLALSSIALILPTPFADYYNLEDEHVLTISRVSAIFLLSMYLQLLFFQLYTHAHIFEDAPVEKKEGEEEEEAEDEEEAALSWGVALSGLCITTLLVTFFSNFLVDSISGYCESSGVSRTFVGLIILPIVGNAVEHITAVTVAMKDKMDLSMGVAIGSCTQISLFVVPLTVLVGWALGKPMTLNFPHFEIILYVLSVMTVSIVINYPMVNWLEGSLLITTYIMIAVGFWYENVVDFR